jgi:hypothetical protein
MRTPPNISNPNRRLVPPYLVMEENDEQSKRRDVRWQSRFHNAKIHLSPATSPAEMDDSLRTQARVLKKSMLLGRGTSSRAGVAPAEIQRLSRRTVSSNIAMARSRRAAPQESARSAHTFQHTPPSLAIPDLQLVAFQFEGTRLVGVGEIRR